MIRLVRVNGPPVKRYFESTWQHASELPRILKGGCLSPISTVDLCHEHPKVRPIPELGACTLLISATGIVPLIRHACTEGDASCPRRRRLAVAGIIDLEW